MEFLSKALESLPSIAGSPLAFVGYVLTVGAWAFAVFRSRRLKLLLARLADIPETDRRAVIQLEMGEVLPDNISADEWLRGRRLRYFFVAFTLLLATVVSIFAMSVFMNKARLVIDGVQEVLPPGSRNMQIGAGVIRVQYKKDVRGQPLTLEEDKAAIAKYRYTFDVTLRNPSAEHVNVTELRVIFDPGTGGGLANVQEISGTYVVAVRQDGATTTGPLGRFRADAWYPSGSGRLHVKTPLAQTLAPNSVDRVRIVVEFPNDYAFLGPMEEAVLQVYWNQDRYEKSAPIALAKR